MIKRLLATPAFHSNDLEPQNKRLPIVYVTAHGRTQNDTVWMMCPLPSSSCLELGHKEE